MHDVRTAALQCSAIPREIVGVPTFLPYRFQGTESSVSATNVSKRNCATPRTRISSELTNAPSEPQNHQLYSADSAALRSTNARKTGRLALVMHRFATSPALDTPAKPSATRIDHEIEAGETSSPLQKRQTVERLATDRRKGKSRTPFRQNGHQRKKAYPSRTRAVIRRIQSRTIGIGFPGAAAGVWFQAQPLSAVNFLEGMVVRYGR